MEMLFFLLGKSRILKYYLDKFRASKKILRQLLIFKLLLHASHAALPN
jgi:hypothetical protein